ncbi:DNA polymerase eta-like isoform X2 [Ornithodoros turicata]
MNWTELCQGISQKFITARALFTPWKRWIKQSCAARPVRLLTKGEASNMQRAIVLVDMDCFYVQVEEKLAPQYKGKPCAVSQYNQFQGGGLIAVNYEARAAGIKRGMRGDAAMKLCRDLHLFRVPEVRGKADLTRYRNAGGEVLQVMSQFSGVIERASIDEAYLDLSDVLRDDAEIVTPTDLPNTHVVGSSGTADSDGDIRAEGVSNWLSSITVDSPDYLLARAAKLVEEIRLAVLRETGYRCSAGIAHNKVLAKLACGLHKPNQQTVLTQGAVPSLFATLPVNKVRNLGGKLGEDIKETLQVETLGEVTRFSQESLITTFGEKTGSWLYHLSRGIDHEPVTLRKLAKSIGCGKNFNGKLALNTRDKVKYWVQQLAEELAERLQRDREQNSRTAQLLVVGVRQNHPGTAVSRSCPLTCYDSGRIMNDALSVLSKLNTASPADGSWFPPLCNISLAASKFKDTIKEGTQDISKFLSAGPSATGMELKSSSTLPETLSDSHPSKDTLRDTASKSEETIKPLSFADRLMLLLHDRGDVKAKNDRGVVEKPSAATVHPNRHQTVEHGTPKKFLVDPESVDMSVLPFLPPSIKDEIEYSMKHSTAAEKKVTGLRKYFKSSPSKQDTSMQDANRASSVSALTDDSWNDSAKFVHKAEGSAQEDRCDSVALEESNVCQHEEDSDSRYVTVSASDAPEGQSLKKEEGGSMPGVEMSKLDCELVRKCGKCGKDIPVWEVQEHEDYHLACDLSSGLDRTQVPLLKRKKVEAAPKKG